MKAIDSKKEKDCGHTAIIKGYPFKFVGILNGDMAVLFCEHCVEYVVAGFERMGL